MLLAEIVLAMRESCIFTVVRVDTIERGLEIADGCYEGGVTCMEISYTNPNAGEVIEAITKKYRDKMIVGAGTVLDATTARMAIMHGAKFIVAPNFDEQVLDICNLYQIPYGPGCSTYTEAITATRKGASFIKCFPISNYYGPSLAKIFRVPCPQLNILASGGVTKENLHEWIENGADWVGIGGLLTKGTKEEIAENAKALHNIVVETRAKLKSNKSL